MQIGHGNMVLSSAYNSKEEAQHARALALLHLSNGAVPADGPAREAVGDWRQTTPPTNALNFERMIEAYDPRTEVYLMKPGVDPNKKCAGEMLDA